MAPHSYLYTDSMPNNSKQAIYESPSVKRALNGESNINAIDAFKRAHELTKSSFSVMAAASAIVLIIVMLVLMTALHLLNVPIAEYQNVGATQRAVIDIVMVLVLSPLMAGLLMMGINKARGHSPQVMDLFKWLKIAIILALGSLIASILMQIGISLFILPGLYIAIATTFTLTLIADKQLTAISAIILSVRVVNKYLSQFIIFFLISMALFVVIGLTLFLAGLWLMPLYFNAKGILYEELFGDENRSKVEENHPQGSFFDA